MVVSLDQALAEIPAEGLFDAAKTVAQKLNDEQLQALRVWALIDEPARRAREEVARKAEADIVESLVKTGSLSGTGAPQEDQVHTPLDVPAWVDPGTDRGRMYLPGQVVSHGGKLWVSRHPGLNCWQPGAEGVDERIWQEWVTPESQPPVTQPDDSGHAKPALWAAGVQVVVGEEMDYQGVVYRVVQAHMTQAGWEPPNVPALWTKAG